MKIPGPQNSIASETSEYRYAGFWLRLVAFLLDCIFINTLPSVALALLFYSFCLTYGYLDDPSSESEGPAMRCGTPLLAWFFIIPAFILIIFSGSWFYYSLFESSRWQSTPGKKLMGLKVTNLQGNRIGLGRATGRYFAKVISTLVLLIGYIMIAFTHKKQGLHDMIAGTVVVKGKDTHIK